MGSVVHVLLPLIAIFALVMGACSVPGFESRATQSNRSTQVNLLDESTCEAPCWSGLTPGESKSEEVHEVVETLPFLDLDSFEEINQDLAIGGHRFAVETILVNCDFGESPDCVRFDISDGVLERSSLRHFSDHPFSVMLDRYGDYSHVDAIPVGVEKPDCMIWAGWQERRMTAQHYKAYDGQWPYVCQEVSDSALVPGSLPVTGVFLESEEWFDLRWSAR